MTPDESELSENSAESQDLARALPRLTREQIHQVSPRLVRQTFAGGEEIIRQGDVPDRFYIVIDGQAEVWHQNMSGESEVVDVRKPGEYFGEIGLLRNQPRTATVRAPADGEVEVLALERQDFEALLDDSRATESQIARDMIRRLIQLANFQS